MSGSDRLEDSFPHGTVDGFKAGCRGVICPAAAEHGLSCQRAKQLAAGDYQYQKLARRGATPAEIAEALGLHPTVTATRPARRPKPAPVKIPDLPDEVDPETQEAPMPNPTPTPRDVAAKVPAPKSGPTQAEVRAWARANGIDVNTRGTVRADVMQAYTTAHEAPAPKSRREIRGDVLEALTVDAGGVPVDEHGMRREFTLPHEPPVDVAAELLEEGRRLASERDDLIAAGGDPVELLVPRAFVVIDEVRELNDQESEDWLTPSLALSVARAERDTAQTALEFVLRKWADQHALAQQLSRQLTEQIQVAASYRARIDALWTEAAADRELLASMDRMVADQQAEIERLRAPRGLLRRAS